MIDDSRLVLISYPSGGFGNFIYYMLTEFSSNTYKVDNKNFDFDESGNSHNTIKYTPVYFQDPDSYSFPKINTDHKLLILCDNGINNDSYEKISSHFKSCKIIRLIIDEPVRPVIYNTCVTKAMLSNVNTEIADHVNDNWIDATEDYAIRENFTLFYRNWPFKWNPVYNENIINVSIKDLIDDPILTISNLINDLGGTVILKRPFEYKCKKWLNANSKYFVAYREWQKIEHALDNLQKYDMSAILELHDQGYINYCIECKYKIVIPVYDYRYWFTNTLQILDAVKKL